MRVPDPYGLGPVPLLEPLSYPGRVLDHSALLDGDQLLPCAAFGEFDRMLAGRRAAPLSARTPVIAVGSNGSPAQLRHKFGQAGVDGVVPMVPTPVDGVRVGVSAHVGRAGYVPAAPCAAPGVTSTLVVSWLDDEQLRVVDASESANYRRLPSPDGSGEMYVSRRGLLTHPHPNGRPRSQPQGPGGQRALISELLAASAALRALFGESPEEWVRIAREDDGARLLGARVFAEEGWVGESGFHGFS